MTTRTRLAILAILIALSIVACDDGATNPGTYPCSSNIAPCVTPAP